jgi:predicted MFS family arabinose efflux permease
MIETRSSIHIRSVSENAMNDLTSQRNTAATIIRLGPDRLASKSSFAVYYGWVVVAASAIGLFFGAFPIVVFSFGVFYPAFVRDFHTSRAAVALAFTLHNTVGPVCAVWIGALADRFGPRRIILLGLTALGIILLSAQTIGTTMWKLYIFYIALGAVSSATTALPYSLAVSGWFDRRRGLALGIMMGGLGAGAIVVPPIAQWLILHYGWRTAFTFFGCGSLIVGIPTVAVFLRNKSGDPQSKTRSAPRALASQDLLWREIWSSSRFWIMIAIFMTTSASVHACFIHLPQIVAHAGATTTRAAIITSVLGLAVLIGRVGTGYCLDRYFGPYVASFLFFGGATGVAFLFVGAANSTVYIAAFLVGLAFGAEMDVMVFLLGRYFGLRNLGKAFGVAFGAFVLAGGLGPLIMGLAFDKTGSYRDALGFFSLATAAASVVTARLGPYRFSAPTEEKF